MAQPGDHETAGTELRAAPRVSLMLRAAKLVCPAGEFLCILRDVSTTGLKAKLFHDLPPVMPLALELDNGERYPVEPVWECDGHAGFRFAEGPVELSALIDDTAQFPKRQLRLQLDLPIIVSSQGMQRAARLRNVSQHGALIEVEHGLALRQIVQLGGGLFPERHARVRWRRAKAHGVVFHQGFRLDELAQLVRRLQPVDDATQSPARVNH